MFPLPACDRTSRGDRLSGETSGAPLYTYTHVQLRVHGDIVCAYRGWQRSVARILLPPNLSLPLLFHPPLPSSFFSSLFSVSFSLPLLPPSTSLFPPARYFIIISSLSRLAGFPANDAFPCNDRNPSFIPARVSPTRKLLSADKRDNTARHSFSKRMPGHE